jgi:hypothetical protein
MTRLEYRHCIYQENWQGEYPYSSVCKATVETRDGLPIARFDFATAINPKGETDQEYCRRWAKGYVPPGTTLDQLIAELQEDGFNLGYIQQKLEQGYESCKFFRNDRPIGWQQQTQQEKKNACLRQHWKSQWEKCHKVRRWWRSMEKSPTHLLLWMIHGIDYLHGSPYDA